MLHISFVELLASARESLTSHYVMAGPWITLAGFFGGMGLIALIDRLVPESENPHDAIVLPDKESRSAEADLDEHRLMRMGMLTGVAIAIHNFPEGMATFVAALAEPTRGVSVAIAIAIHNIPEDIAVALPIYYATRNRRKELGFSLLSGVTEPIRDFVGYTLLRLILPEQAMGVIEAAVAGIMVFISLDQLIPNAHAYNKGHLPMWGMVGGMVIMALTLVVL